MKVIKQLFIMGVSSKVLKTKLLTSDMPIVSDIRESESSYVLNMYKY